MSALGWADGLIIFFIVLILWAALEIAKTSGEEEQPKPRHPFKGDWK